MEKAKQQCENKRIRTRSDGGKNEDAAAILLDSMSTSWFYGEEWIRGLNELNLVNQKEKANHDS